jgi:hypothetical protein
MAIVGEAAFSATSCLGRLATMRGGGRRAHAWHADAFYPSPARRACPHPRQSAPPQAQCRNAVRPLHARKQAGSPLPADQPLRGRGGDWLRGHRPQARGLLRVAHAREARRPVHLARQSRTAERSRRQAARALRGRQQGGSAACRGHRRLLPSNPRRDRRSAARWSSAGCALARCAITGKGFVGAARLRVPFERSSAATRR